MNSVRFPFRPDRTGRPDGLEGVPSGRPSLLPLDNYQLRQAAVIFAAVAFKPGAEALERDARGRDGPVLAVPLPKIPGGRHLGSSFITGILRIKNMGMSETHLFGRLGCDAVKVAVSLFAQQLRVQNNLIQNIAQFL